MIRTAVVTIMIAASTAAAQFPTAPPPVVREPSNEAEFRVSGFMITGDRALEFANNVSTTTGSIRGADLLLRASGAGISLRVLSGEFGRQPHITSADARVYLLPKEFSIFIGAARRALWSDLNPDAPATFDVGMGGISSTLNIGASGIRTNLTAAYYFPAGPSKERVKDGMEGEASVMYVFPVVPFFVQAGYRTEVFTQVDGTRFTPEIIRGVRFGGGLQLGGR
ncbi:MAG TPA: hypothetical protein VEB19_02305 [Gemmatimonadaceae bacterium]|nr:hypothetical protein [Gemmatimonadaceae bacterium]